MTTPPDLTHTETWVKQGDLMPPLVYIAWDPDWDPTGVLAWTLRGARAGVTVFEQVLDLADVAADPDDPKRVLLTYQWQPGDTDVEGRISVEAEATWPDGPQTWPTVVVTVRPDVG